MPTYYHVAPDTYRAGTPLESLYAQVREQAYDLYAERWPDAGTLGQAHVHYVHLHATLAEAQMYLDAYGGRILAITLDDQDDVVIDQDEYPHPMVEGSIPASAVTPPL